MRILLVEDDSILGDGIVAGLKLGDYAVDWVRDGESARLALLDHPYDACVLDLGLPKKDGIAVLRELRSRGNATPVLVLTARDTPADKIAGLDAGADDYLTKPFAFSELLARIQALIRRASATPEPTGISVGDLHVDLLRHVVTRAGKTIALQPREFSLLEYLARNAGRPVSKTMIMEHVWDYNFDPQTNVVESRICRLRDKIDKGFDKPLIHTVRGMGYVLKDAP